jgi:HK97 family phage prohead protease
MTNKKSGLTCTKDITLELSAKALSEVGNGEVEGYASVFGNIDHVNDVIERGAFTKTIQMNQGKIRFLWQHDRYQPIGAITELREDEKGLYFRAKFADTPRGQEARELLKMEGAMGGFSIGYQVLQEIGDEQPGGRIINRIKEVRLLEISAVTFPCNEQAIALGVKSDMEDLTNEENALLEQFKTFLLSQRTPEPALDPEEGSLGISDPVEAAQEDESEEADTIEVVEVVEEKSEALEALIAIKSALEIELLRNSINTALRV